jgi:HK97 gp10 family phage protein
LSTSKVRGIAQVQRAFKAAPDIVQQRLGKVNETTAVAIASRARAGVPVRFGFLKKHIAHTFSKKTGTAKVGIAKGTVAIAGRQGSALTRNGATSATPSVYAKWVERGTSHSKAQPFMGPAVRAEQQPHLERIRREKGAIEREIAAAGGARD